MLGDVAGTIPRPYFGIIADGIHLHPTTIKIAWNAHPDGFILVTDAMHMADGVVVTAFRAWGMLAPDQWRKLFTQSIRVVELIEGG